MNMCIYILKYILHIFTHILHILHIFLNIQITILPLFLCTAHSPHSLIISPIATTVNYLKFSELNIFSQMPYKLSLPQPRTYSSPLLLFLNG